MMKNSILIKVCRLAVMSSEKAKNSMIAQIPTLSAASYRHAVSWPDISLSVSPKRNCTDVFKQFRAEA